jgi:hypothetical protein
MEAETRTTTANLRRIAGSGKRPMNALLTQSPEERVAELCDMIARAANGIVQISRAAPGSDLHDLSRVFASLRLTVIEAMRRLPTPHGVLCRDPELTDLLERIEQALTELASLRGREYDLMLGAIRRLAAPDALPLYYEVKRLDALLWAALARPVSTLSM